MKKILTLVLSGIGIAEDYDGNAVEKANMVNFKKFYENNPHTELYVTGEQVGLEENTIPSGETSFRMIGSGRCMESGNDLVNKFLTNYETNEKFSELLTKKDKRIHLIGMCSDGNIHSNINHLIELYKILINNGFTKIYFHLITDGIDTESNTSIDYIDQIASIIKKNKIGSIATICGRNFAMDRDNNYEMTEIYYKLITGGNGLEILNYESTIKACYEKDITDATLRPLLYDEKGIIKNNDIIIWTNFRAERSKQILSALVNPKFDKFKTKNLDSIEVYTFLTVDKSIKTNVLINNDVVENPFGVYLSKLGVRQARVAESDRFNHVTTFFDGSYNGKLNECDKYQIPISVDNNTINHPELNAAMVTKKIMDCMEKDYNFILANLANADTCAHTGDFNSTVMSLRIIDACLNRILKSAEDNFYTVIITSDVGNAEHMLNEDLSADSTHTCNKVPFVIGDSKVELKNKGNITNIAATILDYMDISIPLQMTSESIIKK